MTYRLTITKIEDNPNYDEQKARESEASNRVGMPMNYRELPELERRELGAIITEEEFTAIKHALLEVWK